LRRLAEIIGPAGALKLREQFGGQEDFYIPKTPRITHEFTPVIGLDKLELLCAEFGGQRIDIPRGAYMHLKKALIADMGGSNRAVAHAVGATQRYVRRVRGELRDTTPPDQLDLLDRLRKKP
jgi:hypothetical protein